MDFLTNILSGGILGVVTSAISTWLKYKEVKESNDFKLKMIKAQSDASIEEIKAQVQMNKVIVEGNVSTEYAKAEVAETASRSSLIANLTANYIDKDVLIHMLSDNTLTGRIFKPLLFLHLIVMDFVRGMVRPILTAGIMYYIIMIVNQSLGTYLVSGNTVDLLNTVINPALTLLLFSASTVISFWFADKSMSRRFQEGKK